jgi:hypothetical protein
MIRTTRHLFVAIAVAAAVAAINARPAAAWNGRWCVGLEALSSHVGKSDEADAVTIETNAGGGGMQVGYLVSPSFMVRMWAGAADHETSDPDVTIRFGGGSFDAVYLFRPGTTFRPYVFGGVGGYMAESQQDDLTYDVSGPGIAFGGGAHLQLANHWTLHGSLRLESINWDTATVTYDGPDGDVQIESPIDDSGWASRVSVGIAAWF